MRPVFAAFLVFLCNSALFAQLPQYELELSDRHRIATSPDGVKLLYSNADELCLLKSIQTSDAIERPWMLAWYSQDGFHKMDSLVFDLREQGRKCDVDQLIKINNRFILIYSLVTDHHRKITVFARELDPSQRRLTGESKKILEFESDQRRRVRAGRMNFTLSPDNTKIFFMRGFSHDGRNREVALFAALDTTLRERWKKVVTLPYPVGMMTVKNLKLSNDGDAFALILVKTANQVNLTFDLLMVRQHGTSVVRYSVQSKTGFVSSAQIEINGIGKLLCTGFYSKAGGEAASGVFFNIIETETLQHSETVSDFDTKLVLRDLHPADIATVRSKAELDLAAELNQFHADHILPRPDGGFVLIGEQRYDYSTTARQGASFSRGGVYRNYRNLYQPSRFYRGDLLAVKVNAHGAIEWENKIHKAQDTNDHRTIYASYMVLNIGGKLRLLFNEDRRNITGFALRKEKVFGGSSPVIAIVTLDDEGKSVRELIYDSVGWPMVMSPEMSAQVSDHELLLYGYKHFHEQISMIRFK